jgi:hypothetical protein
VGPEAAEPPQEQELPREQVLPWEEVLRQEQAPRLAQAGAQAALVQVLAPLPARGRPETRRRTGFGRRPSAPPTIGRAPPSNPKTSEASDKPWPKDRPEPPLGRAELDG